MIRIFKHYVAYGVLLLCFVDFAVLLFVAEAGWVLRVHQIGSSVGSIWGRVPQLLSFALAIQAAMIGVGVYSVDALHTLRFAAARLLVAISLGVILISMLFFILPELTLWRSNSVYSMIMAIVLLMAVRIILGGVVGGEKFKRRVVLLGAGRRASRVIELSKRPGSGFMIVECIDMQDVPALITTATPRADVPNLRDLVVAAQASEVVLALDERRKSVPLDDLLRVKTTGVAVHDISSFLERETGRIDLDSVQPSWLIFSDGFSSGQRISMVIKRTFDIVVSALLLIIAGPIILITALIVKLESPGPAFYRQIRVGRYDEPFEILKLRSMRQDAEVGGKAVWAQKGDARVTRVGRIIRLIRVDELPQMWTVLKGGMSFVGPRPERPQFVTELEEKLPFYAERHMMKPGITGWAQINYPYGASLEDARHKLEYDLYYTKNYSLFLDILIILQTLRVLLWAEGAR
ncbi:sugar transferase, PEP-CTERM system associated/exopolysaccharide biosynthesis polyprenyl glycosylphosphotransferase [Sphingomonas sp. YR710]|uniref:TIGR03013 family XrtA/PEP-CTERM system glycosyltransferase n=1 Tax=Sphingomonas sp. YR710 TaxID=1882773 RepID=UPI00088D92F7|nr:TIGR03013 family XrtA/PEP-CTERM system glycosyltransferase [Sphingomonas sp. YR710]SDD02589.1 sugar transferase, PEP-CTERM system associated/exopolysaccharide biosynthesis polyprenyl glycosylphosphotransferase [Sphingomonas sp. YR710]